MRVRALAISCQGLTRALDEITASATGPLPPRIVAGLVDDALASARPHCPDATAATRGGGLGRQLARARLLDPTPERALAELTGMAASSPAVALRRAELLDRLGRPADALEALRPALAGAGADDPTHAQARLLAITMAARAGDIPEIARQVAAAPLPERDRLAHRAVEDSTPETLPHLTSPVAELVVAAADRLEALRGPAAARALRERALELAPDIAEHWDAAGRARIAGGAIAEALAAWDRASALAPAQPAYRITPIRALVIAGETDRARELATALAGAARLAGEVERLITASSGAAAAGDTALALALAREARDRRPGDGRLAFLVAQRLAEAGEREPAARAYADLLVCGAHGQPWHRHEVAARLAELRNAALVARALDTSRACEAVEPGDLAGYVTRLRAGEVPPTAGAPAADAPATGR